MHSCQICAQTFELEDLHKHLRSHKIKITDYYLKYFTRNDLYTKENITVFKDYDSYFDTDFLNKRNMSAWFKSQPKEVLQEYCLKLLKKSKIIRLEKGIDFAPSQTEFKTLMSPSIPTFEKVFDTSFNDILNKVEWKSLFNYTTVVPPESKHRITIAVDTREQNPLLFSRETIKTKLNYGDYTAIGEDFSKVLIDRKSLVDCCSTLSGGFDRFCREMERAEEMGDHIIVLIEEKFSNFQSIGYLPHLRHVKASYEFLSHRLRDIVRKHSNCQFIFADGRKESSRLIIKILEQYKGLAKTTDFQYLYDQKAL